MKILLGTSNRGKVHEMREALDGLGLTLLSLHDIPAIGAQPEETGSTFVENAIQKATFYHQQANFPTVTDDSGIIVEALENELGIHTRRWGAGADATDQEWIDHFLDRMKKEENKRARFVCALAYIDEGGQLHEFEGSCDGVITDDLEASYLPGLPISACFRPDGHSSVFSALSIEQKNSTSHRGRAVHKLRQHLLKESRV
jgi:XTP/dITP diphosphohydrolase